ncbi:hypothetical protein, partial [Lacticaseibacillus rhamnosus]|uniref:hypothetical protein n=1 Tax=Lacticaseibacillus rhamnosus TaxID=47715 RepID=UPI000B1CB15F
PLLAMLPQSDCSSKAKGEAASSYASAADQSAKQASSSADQAVLPQRSIQKILQSRAQLT